MLQFQTGKLLQSLEDLHQKGFTGAAYVDVSINSQNTVRSQIIFFKEGAITYVGEALPNPTHFSQDIGKRLNLKIMNAAIKMAEKKVKDSNSIHAYLSIYTRINLFEWNEIETLMYNQAVLRLDLLLPYEGRLVVNPQTAFDLVYGEDRHGLDWQKLKTSLEKRQQAWAALAPDIPSMDAVPHTIRVNKTHTVDDVFAQQHLQTWIDGQRSLLQIAAEAKQDPLALGKQYLQWHKQGWITFTGGQPEIVAPLIGSERKDLPVILSVDDSLVVQTLIKRAIGEYYQVLTANSAIDALHVLNNNSVELLLLDVTMPDIDGFELCRTVRSIGQFQDLPVIMLTAKDGLLNKMKGQMAGSTHYLTKPIEKEKLLAAIEKYIPSPQVSR
ncbi:response regulator [Acaryochloris sp. IP29b_bin.137]|uniref:response regulator n=1 Tax=Acaryochloris sp. IP29b_bin.137 TaxID=2969217 RepID=UPI00260F27FF|nr:response regulator [Acaryochloris sp. IP29b_bin.137]